MFLKNDDISLNDLFNGKVIFYIDSCRHFFFFFFFCLKLEGPGV